MNCEICGKPQSPYPNWLLSHSRGYHIGCLARDYHDMREAYRGMYDRCIATGVWGPWHDDWEGSYEQKQWGKLEDLD